MFERVFSYVATPSCSFGLPLATMAGRHLADQNSAAARLRKTASTKLNTQSSRSHAVLTVYTSVKPARGGPANEGQLWVRAIAV